MKVSTHVRAGGADVTHNRTSVCRLRGALALGALLAGLAAPSHAVAGSEPFVASLNPTVTSIDQALASPALDAGTSFGQPDDVIRTGLRAMRAGGHAELAAGAECLSEPHDGLVAQQDGCAN